MIRKGLLYSRNVTSRLFSHGSDLRRALGPSSEVHVQGDIDKLIQLARELSTLAHDTVTRGQGSQKETIHHIRPAPLAVEDDVRVVLNVLDRVVLN